MSDAMEAAAADDDEAPTETPIANFSVTPKRVRVANEDVEYLQVTYGDPQATIEIEPPTLGERFRIAGIAPDANDKWVGMALAATSVRHIDGVPYSGIWLKTKPAIRGMLVRLGYDGLRAINRALSSTSGDAAPEPTAGTAPTLPPIPNFSATPSTVAMGKKTIASIKVTFGDPVHTIEIVRPGLGEQFDLMEIGPDAGSLWTGLALAAMSVQSLDGSIVDEKLSEDALGRLLTKLGPLGVAAINQALAPVQATDQLPPSPDEEGDAAADAFKGAVGN